MAVQYRKRSERGLLAALGRLLYEIRYPTTRRGKIIVATLAAVVFAFLSLLVIGAFVLARVLTPPHAGEALDPTRLIGTAQALTFQAPDGTSHNAWFFPGLRRGPVIVLLHGYRSSRSEVLALASTLQEHRYNVLAFNLAGHGESPRERSTLGYQETEELMGALQLISERTDLDAQRVGLWGHSLGAYAAMSAAMRFPGIKALALDSAYAEPGEMLRLELERGGASWVPLLDAVTRLEFRILSYRFRGNNPEPDLNRLAGTPKLFLSGGDQPALAELTQQLYQDAPGPKEFVPLPETRLTMLAEESRAVYVNHVVNFFLVHLAPTPRRPAG